MEKFEENFLSFFSIDNMAKKNFSNQVDKHIEYQRFRKSLDLEKNAKKMSGNVYYWENVLEKTQIFETV